MIDKLLGVFLVLLQVIGFPCMAEVSLEEDFSFKVTLKQDVVDFDTTVRLSFSDDTFDFTSTWKADEDGFSSLKFVGKIEFTEDIDGRAEILFDEEKVKSLKLKVYDSHFPPVDATFQHFSDPRNQPRHRRLPVVVHRVRCYSFPVVLLFNLPPSRLSFANSIASSTHFVVSPRNLR